MACNSWDGKRLMSAFTQQSGHSLPITIFMYYIANFYFEVLSVSSVYSGFYLLLDFANFIVCKQVKNEWFHNAGAGVVAHVADSLKQQETLQDSNSFIVASL